MDTLMLNSLIRPDVPIVFLKSETTGTDIKNDRIIEIYLRKYVKSSDSDGFDMTEFHSIFNPENVQIDDEATKIHGHTNESLKDYDTFDKHADEIFEFIKDCDLIGFYIKTFHLPILMLELARTKKYLNYKKVKITDLHNLYVDTFKPNSFDFAYEKLTNKKYNKASIKEDVNCMNEMVNSLYALENLTDNSNKYFDLTGKILIKDGEYIVNFGSENKFRGKKVIDMFEKDLNYYEWIMSSDVVSIDTKIALKILYNLFLKNNDKK